MEVIDAGNSRVALFTPAKHVEDYIFLVCTMTNDYPCSLQGKYAVMRLSPNKQCNTALYDPFSSKAPASTAACSDERLGFGCGTYGARMCQGMWL